MYNADKNPSQSQQKKDLATTPGRTPAHETARADPSTIESELGAPDKHPPVTETDEKDPDPLPEIELDSIADNSADPVQRANPRIISVDSAGMDASDSTVDTDGKGLDARRGLSPRHDNVVGTNATLANSVTTPSSGLGGIDSRFEGNLPTIALRDGYKMIYHGCTETHDRNGGRVQHLISIEGDFKGEAQHRA
jgi:hypothetical protein